MLFNLLSLKWIAFLFDTRVFWARIADFLRAAIAILFLMVADFRGAKHIPGLETALPFLKPEGHL
jgi:hypothetical protein